MTIFEIIFISIGLAMDCFAVSVASSVAYGKYNWLKIIRMSTFFGLFQGVMPLIGWILGASFAKQICCIDHWLAFVILGYLGLRMIYQSLREKEGRESEVEKEVKKENPYGSLKMLIMLSIATSIDALATGLIFAPMGNLIFTAAGIIALGSFVLTTLGCVIGISFGKKFNLKVEVIGGAILILIGTKILIEHLVAEGVIA